MSAELIAIVAAGAPPVGVQAAVRSGLSVGCEHRIGEAAIGCNASLEWKPWSRARVCSAYPKRSSQ